MLAEERDQFPVEVLMECGSVEARWVDADFGGANLARSAEQGARKSKCWEFGTTWKSGFVGNQPATSFTLSGVTPSPPRSEPQS